MAKTGRNEEQQTQKPEQFQRFEDAMAKILTVSKEEIVKREQAAKQGRNNGRGAKGVGHA